jgi:hypothetical protein
LSDFIEQLLMSSKRKLVVSSREINLSNLGDNQIYILFVEESRGSAGGRAGGSGSRKISRIIGVSCHGTDEITLFDTDKEDEISEFEIPYSAVAMDIKLSDGKSMVVQGLVDHDLTRSYSQLIQKFKVKK